ncbi:hypothetical protein, partial [Staphylococcus pseudintermedius]|uniref:hypothetical protein n=1 Tax=Staphylococcus pseudintermedius TaxID=283734 RepID=UPI001C6DE085
MSLVNPYTSNVELPRCAGQKRYVLNYALVAGPVRRQLILGTAFVKPSFRHVVTVHNYGVVSFFF